MSWSDEPHHHSPSLGLLSLRLRLAVWSKYLLDLLASSMATATQTPSITSAPAIQIKNVVVEAVSAGASASAKTTIAAEITMKAVRSLWRGTFLIGFILVRFMRFKSVPKRLG